MHRNLAPTSTSENLFSSGSADGEAKRKRVRKRKRQQSSRDSELMDLQRLCADGVNSNAT